MIKNLFNFLGMRNDTQEQQSPPDASLSNNRLETLFDEAATNFAARPEFFRQIFHFEIVVIGEVISKSGNTKPLKMPRGQTEENIPYTWGYTSEEALHYHLTREHQAPVSYFVLPTLKLFEMLKNDKIGLMLFGRNHSKLFTPQEISQLLQDPILSQIHFSKDEHMTYGQPFKIPHELLATLKRYLQRTLELKEIYFGQYNTETSNPTLMIVLAFKDDHISEITMDQVRKDINSLLAYCDNNYTLDMFQMSEHFQLIIRAGCLIPISAYQLNKRGEIIPPNR